MSTSRIQAAGSNRRRRVPRILAGLAILLGLVGCTIDRSPRFEFDEAGEKVQFKRFEEHITLDYIHHFTRNMYTLCEAEPRGATLSKTQRTLLAEAGKPDYTRGDFLSENSDLVTEWVYYKEGKIYQFVGGEIVFEGPLTDLDRVLIRRGRPDISYTQPAAEIPRTDILQYRSGLVEAVLDIYHFSDGSLTSQMIN